MNFDCEASRTTDPSGQSRQAGGAAKPSYPLSPRAAALLAQLARSMRLRALPSECPEVLDLLASRWHDAYALARTFEDLLFGTSREVPKLSMLALLEVTHVQRLAAPRLPRRPPSVWDTVFEAAG